MLNANLIVNDLIKPWGTSTPLKATLKYGNTPLTNTAIIFKIHGVEYNRTTDANGTASLNINLEAGTYPCTVRYLGDSTYNPITKEVLVRVVTTNPQPTESKRSDHYFEVNKLPLKVLMNNGFDVKPGQNIKETQLLYDDDHYNSPTFYFNSGYDGDEFECSVLIKESYFHQGRQVMEFLNAWNKMNTVVSVVTDAMVVANGKYTMQIKDKKQDNKEYSIWKLRFKQFYENNLSFEAIYDQKKSTFSSIDLLLLKQTNGINEKSNKDVITALQRHLQTLGYWTSPLSGSYSTAGYWNGIPTAVYRFQVEYMNDVSKVGKCDYETITAIIEAVHGEYTKGA